MRYVQEISRNYFYIQFQYYFHRIMVDRKILCIFTELDYHLPPLLTIIKNCIDNSRVPQLIMETISFIYQISRFELKLRKRSKPCYTFQRRKEVVSLIICNGKINRNNKNSASSLLSRAIPNKSVESGKIFITDNKL